MNDDADTADVIDTGPRRKSYRAIWRWHFYMGLLIAPVLSVLAITGALYLYDSEIERAWYGATMNVTPGERRAPIADQEAAVRRAFPGARLASVVLPHDRTHVAAWAVVDARGTRRTVLVDPWTARVTGSIPEHRRLMHVISDLHGELLLGRPGDWFVELTASGALIMTLTGLWLWWPARWRVRGVLVPRLGATGRAFWRDLHAIPSALLAVGIVFLVLSGLPWSGFWGEQLAKLGTLSEATRPTPNFSAAPTLDSLGAVETAASVDSHAQHRDRDDTAALPWAVRESGRAPPQATRTGATRIALQDVMRIAERRGLTRIGPRLRVFYPEGERDVYTLSLIPDRAQDQRTLYVDPYSGRVLQDIGWRDYSPLGRAVEWGVMAHMGRQFGEPNRLLALTICVGLLVAVFAGIVMWWRRRPSGRMGVPDARDHALPRSMIVAMIALGALFPLAGAALLAFVVVDRIVVARERRGNTAKRQADRTLPNG
jgi:uncharacterized iron-regulated membrane protein